MLRLSVRRSIALYGINVRSGTTSRFISGYGPASSGLNGEEFGKDLDLDWEQVTPRRFLAICLRTDIVEGT